VRRHYKAVPPPRRHHVRHHYHAPRHLPPHPKRSAGRHW
jgi:hypothetical protein